MSSKEQKEKKKDEKKSLDLGALEEDDDFEEFPAEGKLFLFRCLEIFIYTALPPYIKKHFEANYRNLFSFSWQYPSFPPKVFVINVGNSCFCYITHILCNIS